MAVETAVAADIATVTATAATGTDPDSDLGLGAGLGSAGPAGTAPGGVLTAAGAVGDTVQSRSPWLLRWGPRRFIKVW